MAGPPSWLAVRSTSEQALGAALGRVAQRAPDNALPSGPPRVGSVGDWAVAELDADGQIHSWAQGVSDDLTRASISFQVDEPGQASAIHGGASGTVSTRSG